MKKKENFRRRSMRAFFANFRERLIIRGGNKANKFICHFLFFFLISPLSNPTRLDAWARTSLFMAFRLQVSYNLS